MRDKDCESTEPKADHIAAVTPLFSLVGMNTVLTIWLSKVPLELTIQVLGSFSAHMERDPDTINYTDKKKKE